MPTPLLIISDSPTSGTGLGRIARDLAVRIHANLPEFRVGTLGYAGPYSRALGFPQYYMDMHDWVIFNLPEIWKDFAGEEKGVVLWIWDATRGLWFSRPSHCEVPELKQFLTNPPFARWGYFPMDATGVNNRLTHAVKHIMEGFDRVLAYSQWAEDILRNTLSSAPLLNTLTNRPHGIDTSVFFPRPRVQARHSWGQRLNIRFVRGKKSGQYFSIPDDALMVGIVGTNQPRKDWGLGMATVAELARERNVRSWVHTDLLERHWSIPSLLNDFGLSDLVCITTEKFTDQQMAWAYSACDVTLGIGTGEGFGYPIFESLACGTPCIHGNDGGAPEHMPEWMLVEGVASRLEGVFTNKRNVYHHGDWVAKIKSLPQEDRRSLLPDHLDWDNLWPRWAEWLKAGMQ